jgi:hypothetical protein
MEKAQAEYIREEVEKLFGFSLDGFGMDEIINCSDKLTPDEKEWAKEHISWRIYIEE